MCNLHSLEIVKKHENVKISFISCFFLTHPRHYAENSLRLLDEGDGVEGSPGFPGSVCLHPFHRPPASVPVRPPAAGSKAQALWSTRQPTPNIPESGPATTRRPRSLLHYVRMFVSHRLLSAKHKVFYCFMSLTYVTSKPFAVLPLYGRGSCGLSLYSDDALSSL